MPEPSGPPHAPHALVVGATGMLAAATLHLARSHNVSAIARTPARRTGQPDDVAELAYFLLGDAASFITGQTIVTSGGLITMP